LASNSIMARASLDKALVCGGGAAGRGVAPMPPGISFMVVLLNRRIMGCGRAALNPAPGGRHSCL
jgi:hypothetical protein